MIAIILAVLLALAGIAAIVVGILGSKSNSYNAPGGGTIALGALGLVAALIVSAFGMFYTQGEGEAKVLVSATGEVISADMDPGVGTKAPWVNTVDYDIRNQQAIYKGNGQATSDAEVVNGPEITFQDKDKVSGNADVAIRYSIDANKVLDIHKEYGSQENLIARLVDQDMRSVVRNSFSSYTTAGVMESRADLEKGIRDGLEARWEGTGVIVESVALQGVRYPQETQDGFTSAQQSATNLKKAQDDNKVRMAEAENRIVDAQAEADANRIVTESLSDEVLQQNYIDALIQIGKDGNLVVVPEGSTPMVGSSPSN